MSILSYFDFLSSLKFWFSLFAIFILRSIIKAWILRARMPPGPTPWPFVGNLLVFRGAKVGMHETMLSLSKIFGDPMTVSFFNTPFVILSKYELAKEVLQQTTFSTRADSAVLNVLLEETIDGVPTPSQDIAFGKYGPLWQFHRKITSKCIRSIIDAEKLEVKVLEAVDIALEDMLKHSAKVDAKLHIQHIVYNVLASFAYAKTYKIDDPEFRTLLELNNRGNEAINGVVFFDFLPFADSLPLKRFPRVKRMFDVIGEFKSFRRREIEEHRRTFVEGQIRDFCDAILQEQELLKKEGAEQAEQLRDDHINWIVGDFFSAGTDTTTAVLTFFILYMVMCPEIQAECYQQIKGAIGDSPPRIADRPKLQFVDACIMETLRLRPAAPLGLPHAPITDTKIGDYFIPAGANVQPNIYAMHVDPDCWERPLEFNPRLHFLDEKGEMKKPSSFAPFGFGRRVCIGEQLAKNDVFLVVTRLLQSVHLEAIEGVKYTDDYDIKQNLALFALPYNIRVSPRN